MRQTHIDLYYMSVKVITIYELEDFDAADENKKVDKDDVRFLG